MARIKIDLSEKFHFSCEIPVRITDINYGGHVGNDALLSIVHEARMQFFRSLSYTEMNFGGAGMIMADVAIEFKSELFYGDIIIVSVTAGDVSKVSFDLIYKMERQISDIRKTVALAKTGMICYDYEKKKIVAIPEEARQKISG